MKKLIKRIFWSTVTTIMLILILYIIWKYALGSWTFEDILVFLGESLKVLIPLVLIIYMNFRIWLEPLLLSQGRKATAKVIADVIPKSAQVDGDKRTGKDSSQTGSSIILRLELIKRYLKELKVLREKLYLYDFKKLNKLLMEHGDMFFVSSKKHFNKKYIKLLKENNCFLDEYRIKHGIDPLQHLNEYRFRTNKRVPSNPFEDGITPGGHHMLHLLRRYILVFIRVKLIPNYIMSNQPIIEETKISKTGRIQTLFSKIFKVDYISLKMKTPFPFTIGMIIIETETAMFYTNTDKGIEEFINNESGIREFHTILGHLLEEESYLRGITQDKNRPNKTLRELYEGYMHIFQLEFASTRNFFRLNYSIRRFRIKLKLIINNLKLRIFKRKFYQRLLIKKKNRLKKRLSILHQKDLKLWAKGYIVYYIGVYKKIEDSGKKVKFPILWGLKESKSAATAYSMSGFKQINKITDCFGRYNTHMMYTVREAKEQIISMHFNDAPNWTSLDIEIKQMEEMNYPTIHEMNKVHSDYEAAADKSKKSNRFTSLQRQHKFSSPDLKELTSNELRLLCSDLNVDMSIPDKILNDYKLIIIEGLHKEYESFNYKEEAKFPELNLLYIKELLNLCSDFDIDRNQMDLQFKKYKKSLISALSTEYRKFNEKQKSKGSTKL
jgi:hypothetical protein